MPWRRRYQKAAYQLPSGISLAPVGSSLPGKEEIVAELTAAQRKRLKDADFAYIDKDGQRHLPIHDEEHLRNAVQRFGRTRFESTSARAEAATKILRAANRHGIEIGPDDAVSRAAG